MIFYHIFTITWSRCNSIIRIIIRVLHYVYSMSLHLTCRSIQMTPSFVDYIDLILQCKTWSKYLLWCCWLEHALYRGSNTAHVAGESQMGDVNNMSAAFDFKHLATSFTLSACIIFTLRCQQVSSEIQFSFRRRFIFLFWRMFIFAFEFRFTQDGWMNVSDGVALWRASLDAL